jgi:hypothetical protein
MADPQPILVTATHDLRQRATIVPTGTPGEITAMTGTFPTYYTVSFRLDESNELVTVDHLSRMDIHEA